MAADADVSSRGHGIEFCLSGGGFRSTPFQARVQRLLELDIASGRVLRPLRRFRVGISGRCSGPSRSRSCRRIVGGRDCFGPVPTDRGLAMTRGNWLRRRRRRLQGRGGYDGRCVTSIQDTIHPHRAHPHAHGPDVRIHLGTEHRRLCTTSIRRAIHRGCRPAVRIRPGTG